MYNPADWYWTGTPQGWSSTIVIYSSKSAAQVSSIPTAWLAVNAATPWPKDATGIATVAALDAVLTAAGLPASGLTPPAK